MPASPTAAGGQSSRCRQVELTGAYVDWPAVHERAASLSSAHTLAARHRLADILHVATALHLGVSDFLTFDLNQKKLAETEGLVVPV